MTSLSNIQNQKILSFNEAKVREVCRHKIETFKSEASASYANKTTTISQSENNTLKQTLHEIESHYTKSKTPVKMKAKGNVKR